MFLNVNEIFVSIDGEVNYWGQGRLAVFLRLSGCNLRCLYCDSMRTWKPGTKIAVQDVVGKIKSFDIRNITITGGEPLLQRKALVEFLELLYGGDFPYTYKVNIETNGTLNKLDLSNSLQNRMINENICYTIDYKQGVDNYVFGVQETDFSERDTIKFVLQNKEQYKEAIAIVNKLGYVPTMAFSTIYDDLHPKQLIKWMKQDKLDNVLLNCQLHKYLQVQ